MKKFSRLAGICLYVNNKSHHNLSYKMRDINIKIEGN